MGLNRMVSIFILGFVDTERAKTIDFTDVFRYISEATAVYLWDLKQQ